MTEKPHTKFNELSTKEKIEHISEYYKLHILGALLGVLFVFWMLNHYIFNPPPVMTLDVSIYGSYASDEVYYSLEDEALDAARDYNLSLAELYAWEL